MAGQRASGARTDPGDQVTALEVLSLRRGIHQLDHSVLAAGVVPETRHNIQLTASRWEHKGHHVSSRATVLGLRRSPSRQGARGHCPHWDPHLLAGLQGDPAFIIEQQALVDDLIRGLGLRRLLQADEGRVKWRLPGLQAKGSHLVLDTSVSGGARRLGRDVPKAATATSLW